MNLLIFCPSSHLLLTAARCPQCGWERPVAGETGTQAWCPVPLKAGLGGPGRHVFAQPAAALGIVAFPLNSRAIVGLGLGDGQERWRISLDEGLVTRRLAAEGKRFLATLSDERQIGQAGTGRLVGIDPATGKLTMLWQAEGHQLSAAVLSEKHLLLRTSTSELIAFRRLAKLEVTWRVSLDTWWALPPYITGGKVFICDGMAMQGEGRLLAFDLDNGKPAWSKPTMGMLTQPLASHGNNLVFQNGHKQVVALDVHTGEKAWELNFDRLYTSLVIGGGQVFLVARGQAEKDQPGYYVLKALDPASGKTNWEAPLPARVLIPPLWFENKVYLVSEDGHLFAYRDQDGGLLFEQAITDEEDPPRTELFIAEGVLLIGTYSGMVSALRVAEVKQELESPQVYMDRNEFANAAAAYALRGDLRKAARLYADKLRDIPKALALFEHAGLYKEAGALAEAQDLLAEAQQYYEQANEVANLAEVLLKRGDNLGAARCFEQLGILERAAPLFEQAGDLIQARDLYLKIPDIDSFIRLSEETPATIEHIEEMLRQGKLHEAAKLALQNGFLVRAADIFKSIGDEEHELETLLKIVQDKPGESAFERIAELARKAGRFLEEAEALEQLKRPRRTAEAYRRAGMQAEQKSPDNSNWIANLYEKAGRHFAECDLSVEEDQCRDQVAKYRQQAIVKIDGKTSREFKEGEWNTLTLTICNAGYGIAYKVRWKVTADKFDVDEKTGIWILPILGEGRERQIECSIRPKKGEIGEAVPFMLEWFWESCEEEYQDHISRYVAVKSKDDSRPTGQPVILQSGATFIQNQKNVSGDELASGSQKGDRVEIQRGGGISLSAGSERVEAGRGKDGSTRSCPKCSLLNEVDAKFCIYCNSELPGAPTARKRAK